MKALNFDNEEESYDSTLFYEDDDDNDDDCSVDGIQDVSVASLSSSSTPSCQVITRESLLIAQREDLRRVMDLLLVKEHHARTLLICYQWNVDRLFTVFVEKGKAYLFAEAGVTVLELEHDARGLLSFSTLNCNVCIEDVPCNETTRMDCGHTFCNNCWTEHFIVKINDGESKRIRCMAHQCNAICDEGIVRNLVRKTKPELVEKFDHFLLESYIEDNKMVKWCPSIPNCGNAIRIMDDAFCEVECRCGSLFCFKCLSKAHSPCSCLMWEMWSKKCNESDTCVWITVHTKCCPSCGKAVEKNGAGHVVKNFTTLIIVVHVTKPQLRCRMARFTFIGTHYYRHYKGHKDSIKLEAKLEQRIKHMVPKSQENNTHTQDFSWVKNGADRLFRSRRILSYSYVFAFYMFGNELFEGEMTETERSIKQNLFENQQQQLEARVEQISDLMEKLIYSHTIDIAIHIRMQVIALTCTIDDLCKKLYDCIGNDLLGSLQQNTHIIAPYESKGLVQASDFSVHAVSDIHD
uniref:RBR-type E3 ubiquitin transferase n=1 Tax=Chenopodium quinoa TaxID=63459 RepID=A0A803LP04_CHEQI